MFYEYTTKNVPSVIKSELNFSQGCRAMKQLTNSLAPKRYFAHIIREISIFQACSMGGL